MTKQFLSTATAAIMLLLSAMHVSAQEAATDPSTDPEETMPTEMYIIGQTEASGYSWSPNKGQKMTMTADGVFTTTVRIAPGAPGVTGEGFINFASCLSSVAGEWDEMDGHRYAPATDGTWLLPGVKPVALYHLAAGEMPGSYKVPQATYNVTLDLNTMTVSLADTDFGNIYIIGYAESNDGLYQCDKGTALTLDETDGLYKGTLKFVKPSGETYSFFGITTHLMELSNDWTNLNQHRYGPATDNEPLTSDTPSAIQFSGYSWQIAPGEYNVAIDWYNQTLTATRIGGEDPEPVVPPTPTDVYNPSFSTGEMAAFFEAPTAWTDIKVWCWNDAQNFTGSSWPGVSATAMGKAENGNTIWKWVYNGEIPETMPTGIIFSNNGKPQTADFEFTNGGYYTQSGLAKTIQPSAGAVDAPTSDSLTIEVRGGELHIVTTTAQAIMIASIDGRFITRQLMPGDNTVSGLQRGIYIINGRKIAL